MLKVLKIFAGLLVSLFAILLLTCTVFLYEFKEPVYQIIESEVQNEIFEKTGFQVYCEEFNFNFTKEISITSLVVEKSGKKMLTADSVSVSYSLIDLVYMFFTEDNSKINVDINGLSADISHEDINYLIHLSDTLKENEENSEEEKKDFFKYLISNLTVDFTFKDTELSIEYMDNLLTIPKALIQIKLSDGLTFNGAKITADSLSAYIQSIDLNLDVETFFAIYEDSLKLNTAQTSVNFLSEEIQLSNVNFELFSSDILNLLNGQGKADVDFHINQILQANSMFDFNEMNFKIDINLNDFSVWENRDLIVKYIPLAQSFLQEETTLDGTLSINGLFNDNFPKFDAIIQLNGNNFNFQERTTNASINLKASGENYKLDIPDFKILFDDYQLDYNGNFDLKTLNPTGNFSIKEVSSDSKLIDLKLLSDENSGQYQYIAYTPLFYGITVTGVVEDFKNGSISSNATVESKYASLPFEIKLNLNPLSVNLNSESLEVSATIDEQKKISLSGNLKNFDLQLSEGVTVNLACDFSGYFDTTSSDFQFDGSNSKIALSQTRELNFNFTIGKNFLKLSEISLKADTLFYDFLGQINVNFSNLTNILAKDFSSLTFKCDLQSSTNRDFINMAFNGKEYYGHILLFEEFTFDILGENLDFMAEVNLPWFSFSAESDKGIVQYSSSGNSSETSKFKIKTLKLDIPTKTINGSFEFTNTLHNIAGDVHQGFTVDITGCLNKLNFSSLTLEGIDFEGHLKFAFSNFYLDKYTIDDFSVDCFIDNAGVEMQSSVIDGSFSFEDLSFDLSAKEGFFINFDATGKLKNTLDISIENINIPVALLNQFANIPQVTANSGTINGQLSITGNFEKPVIFGMLEGNDFSFDVFWLKDQILTAQKVYLSIANNYITIAPCIIFGNSLKDFRTYNVKFQGYLSFENLQSPEYDLLFTSLDNALDFWYPYSSGSLNLNVLGDVKGFLDFSYSNDEYHTVAEAFAENMNVSMVLPDEIPDWYFVTTEDYTLKVDINVGSNVEFFYPDEKSSFLNFTLSEGSSLTISYDSVTNSVEGGGELNFKSGRIYYFNNEFSITDGCLYLTDDRFSGTIKNSEYKVAIDLTAELNEYNQYGELVEIYLILKNSTLTEINPRFESSSNLTENEIIQLLGQGFISTNSENSIISSAAYVALMAGDAISRLGIINLGQSFSINQVIKNLIGFDIISVKSPLIQNIFIHSVFSTENQDLSLTARYLDGSTLFAGKYLSDNIFSQLSFALKANDKDFSNYGHVLVDDLKIDMEFSLDWENDLGTYTLFVQPQKFSVSNILDTIGFGFTKRISF